MIRIWPALAVVLAMGLAGAGPAFGAFPGENGKIAFFSDRHGGDFDIWTMDSDGRHLVNLTAKSKADDFSQNWRADGRRIAFMSDRVTATNPEGDYEIFIIGSHQRQITFNALDDETRAWSPDDRRIVFVRDFDPIEGQVDDDLFTMNADGTDQRNLTSSPGVQDQEPNWSPDGRRIAFVSDRDGDLEVYTMRPNGSSVRQLTFNDAFEFRPNWSPDSGMITFTSDRDGDFGVYVMDADGTNQTNETASDTTLAAGKEASSSQEIGATETTRYLCAATHLDARFCELVMTDVVQQPYRAVGPTYGVDVAAVARHAVAARRRRVVRDLALSVALAALAAVVAWRVFSSDDLGGPRATLAAVWPALIPLLAAWFVVAGEIWIMRVRVLPRLLYGRFDPAGVHPRANRHIRRRLNELAEAHTGNVVVFSGFDPFVGSGVPIEAWSVGIDAAKGHPDSETGRRETPVRFEAEDLYVQLMRALQSLGLPGLRVSERLFVNGFDVGYDARLLPDRLAPPVTRAPESVVRERLRDHASTARTYLCLEATGWHGHLVVTVFVRAVRLRDSLFIEGAWYALLPLKDEYYRIDVFRPPSSFEAFFTAFAIGSVRTLPRLAASVGGIIAAARRSRAAARRWKSHRWIIEEGKVFDYGAATSIRELAAGDDPNRYFLRRDLEMYVKLAEKRLLNAIASFLRDHGVDTADFEAQQLVINQNGTVQNFTVGKVIGGVVAQGAGASAQAGGAVTAGQAKG